MKKALFNSGILFLLVCIIFANYSWSQHKNFALAPHYLDVSSIGNPNPVSIGTLGGNSFECANSYYDENGHLQFTVSDNGVYGGNGNYIGALLPYYALGYEVTTNNYGEIHNNYVYIGREVSIVPIPGQCLKFYIIYTMNNNMGGTAVIYMVLDCNGTPTLTSTTSGPSGNYIGGGLLANGLALSKKINSNNDRYLFYGGASNVNRATITANGIGSTITIAQNLNGGPNQIPSLFPGANNFAHELELSPDQQYLAWRRGYMEGVSIIELSGYTYSSHWILPFDEGSVEGIEFDNDSQRLFISAQDDQQNPPMGGLYVYDDIHNTNTPQVIIDQEEEHGNTFLEMAHNEFIYGVTTNDELFYIDPSSGQYNNTGIQNIQSNATNPGIMSEVTYSMNDQIDGMDYGYYSGVSIANVNFILGGVGARTSPPIEFSLCDNQPVYTLDASNAGILEWRLTKYQTNVNGTTVINSTTSNWTTNSSFNLTNFLPLPNNLYYMIVIEGRNECGHIEQKKALIHWKVSPAAVPNFTINYSANSGNSCTNMQQLYNCAGNNATLVNWSTYAPQVRFEVNQLSSPCSTSGSTNVISTPYSTTFPTDLFNLPGTNGTYLSNHIGYFEVKLYAKNNCGIESLAYTKYINMATTPAVPFVTRVTVQNGQTFSSNGCTIPSNTQFTYQDGPVICGSSGIWNVLMEHSSVSTPNDVGRYVTTFDFNPINNSAGTLNNQVNVFTDKWDGSNWVNMNLNSSLGEVTNSASAIPLTGLLAESTTHQYSHAFSNSSLTPDGTIYRIRVTYVNACGSVSTQQIIKLNTIQLKKPENTGNSFGSFVDDELVLVYPNPASETINFSVKRSDKKVVGIVIQDLTGREVAKANIAEETLENFIFRANIADLTTGTYLYTLVTDAGKITSKFYKE